MEESTSEIPAVIVSLRTNRFSETSPLNIKRAITKTVAANLVFAVTLCVCVMANLCVRRYS